MKKKIKYTDAPSSISSSIKSSVVVEDFLPPPNKLILKEENSKVTIILSKKSISFFKDQSKKSGIPYQTMIKKVLDLYTDHYSK
ncbi:toxin-antitoxin system, antitoxin component, ribbon-helix-helix domain protein [Leptospira broomii serovar Hurstbridge str. 5399]|uniref:Toxin-antitoxin system, antitoxin component, ribbon-helix-helix domain protein n=2 Tax=Leptospira broomii TaxID=301541 RepID=T0GGH9_9LEPT|nr:toxin-antitoxin system, antitoxin component, ribbon-helix-helix domain protein [Leptospira broomii serovar Hurstbridge str. 5399]